MSNRIRDASANASERWFARAAAILGVAAVVLAVVMIASVGVGLHGRFVTQSTPGSRGEFGWMSRQFSIAEGSVTYYAAGALSTLDAPTRSAYRGVRTGVWLHTPDRHMLTMTPRVDSVAHWQLPLWIGVMSAAVGAAICWRRFVYLRGIRRDGLCPTCGYDLRATPDRCPECGISIARSTTDAGLLEESSMVA